MHTVGLTIARGCTRAVCLKLCPCANGVLLPTLCPIRAVCMVTKRALTGNERAREREKQNLLAYSVAILDEDGDSRSNRGLPDVRGKAITLNPGERRRGTMLFFWRPLEVVSTIAIRVEKAEARKSGTIHVLVTIDKWKKGNTSSWTKLAELNHHVSCYGLHFASQVSKQSSNCLMKWSDSWISRPSPKKLDDVEWLYLETSIQGVKAVLPPFAFDMSL